MNIPLEEQNDVFSLGFSRTLQREIKSNATGVVYDTVDNALNTGSILSGGNLNLKTLTIGGLVRQVAPGDDIQAAIDAVNREGGGTVQLLSATYLLSSSLTLRSNVVLMGVGNTVLDFEGRNLTMNIVGSRAYSAGNVNVTNRSLTVTGSSTSWTSSMVGQSILIGDYWYEIAEVGSATSITLGTKYIGGTESAIPHVIATTVAGVELLGFTIQNSGSALIRIQYADNIQISNVVIYNGLIGIDGADSSFLFFDNFVIDGCGTGLSVNNFQFGTIFNSGIINCTGDAFVGSIFRNWAVFGFSFENCGGRGMAISSCSNCGFEDYSIRNNGGIGIEFIATNDSVVFSDGTVFGNVSDGLRLTATSDYCSVSLSQIQNNGGYGINVASSTSDDTSIIGNSFISNTLGAINNLGIGTIADNNSGVPVTQQTDIARMKNTSGSGTSLGDVVVLKSVAAGDEVTTTATNGDRKVLGTVVASVASNEYGRVLTKGTGKINVTNGVSSITIGDWLSTYSHAYYAKKAIAGEMAFAISLEAPTTGTAQVNALLVSPRLI